MISEIKLVVKQNDLLIQEVTKTIDSKHFIKSLEEFQVEVNAALTKIIEEHNGIDETPGDANMDEDEEDDTDDDVETKMESKAHSESKKKKHC